ncbi:hypothetical protein B0H16DRAFT_1801200 [Mycena metata]|uniref:Uncharacterized protein n=1 Tax=Mycena metata TaxID=1033252 RepID=A0AAD7JJJ0_9AGAR|nr:hypothetical protein B0H16DRAFT_1801200 [Mycena metata]
MQYFTCVDIVSVPDVFGTSRWACEKTRIDELLPVVLFVPSGVGDKPRSTFLLLVEIVVWYRVSMRMGVGGGYIRQWVRHAAPSVARGLVSSIFVPDLLGRSETMCKMLLLRWTAMVVWVVYDDERSGDGGRGPTKEWAASKAWRAIIAGGAGAPRYAKSSRKRLDLGAGVHTSTSSESLASSYSFFSTTHSSNYGSSLSAYNLSAPSTTSRSSEDGVGASLGFGSNAGDAGVKEGGIETKLKFDLTENTRAAGKASNQSLQGPEEVVEEAFLDVEYKSRSGGQPDSGSTLVLFEEFVSCEYRLALAAAPPGTRRRLPSLFSPSPSPSPSMGGKTWKQVQTLNGRLYVLGATPPLTYVRGWPRRSMRRWSLRRGLRGRAMMRGGGGEEEEAARQRRRESASDA